MRRNQAIWRRQAATQASPKALASAIVLCYDAPSGA